jgi:ornithine cyclodeaminase/alanine dehydrogenase-like protein (mu-crystallin family)
VSSWARRRVAAPTRRSRSSTRTGLAVQDLAVAIAAYERWRANPDDHEFVGVTEISF